VATPSHSQCMFYPKDITGMGLPSEVAQWFTESAPPPHGRIKTPTCSGAVYHLQTLMDERARHPEWPGEIHGWLQSRGGVSESLVVVWEARAGSKDG